MYTVITKLFIYFFIHVRAWSQHRLPDRLTDNFTKQSKCNNRLYIYCQWGRFQIYTCSMVTLTNSNFQIHTCSMVTLPNSNFQIYTCSMVTLTNSNFQLPNLHMFNGDTLTKILTKLATSGHLPTSSFQIDIYSMVTLWQKFRQNLDYTLIFNQLPTSGHLPTSNFQIVDISQLLLVDLDYTLIFNLLPTSNFRKCTYFQLPNRRHEPIAVGGLSVWIHFQLPNYWCLVLPWSTTAPRGFSNYTSKSRRTFFGLSAAAL